MYPKYIYKKNIHMQKSQSKKYKCIKCKKEFKSDNLRKKHKCNTIPTNTQHNSTPVVSSIISEISKLTAASINSQTDMINKYCETIKDIIVERDNNLNKSKNIKPKKPKKVLYISSDTEEDIKMIKNNYDNEMNKIKKSFGASESDLRRARTIRNKMSCLSIDSDNNEDNESNCLIKNNISENCYTSKNQDRQKKKNISHTLRRLVWNKWVGEEIGSIKCPCCNLTIISQLTFVCGHIITESKGGLTTIDNLRPICASCNSSMNNKNMNEFINELNKTME